MSGLEVAQYFASEIDKNAIHVAQNNYPDIIQLGDVNNTYEQRNNLYGNKQNRNYCSTQRENISKL